MPGPWDEDCPDGWSKVPGNVPKFDAAYVCVEKTEALDAPKVYKTRRSEIRI